MKNGFSLLEIIIGIALTGIISTALYNTYWTLLRANQIGQQKIDTDMRIAIFMHQIEKDLTGIFVPNQAIPDIQEVPDETQPKDSAQPKKEIEKKAPKKVLEKAFYSANKNDQLAMITFITSSLTKAYQMPQTAEQIPSRPGTPHYARVMYRMQKSPDNPEAFVVTRQESDNLDAAAFDPKNKDAVHAYQIIDNVKSLKISYLRPREDTSPEKAPSKKKSSSKKKKPQHERSYEAYESSAVWPPATQKKDELIDIPHIIIIELVLWNLDGVTDQTTTLHVPSFVLPQLYPIAQEEPEEPEKTGLKDKEPEAPKPAPVPPPPPTVVTLTDKQKEEQAARHEFIKRQFAQFKPQGARR